MKNSKIKKLISLIRDTQSRWIDLLEEVDHLIKQPNGNDRDKDTTSPGHHNYTSELLQAITSNVESAVHQLDDIVSNNTDQAKNFFEKSAEFKKGVELQLEKLSEIKNDHLRERARQNIQENMHRFLNTYVESLRM